MYVLWGPFAVSPLLCKSVYGLGESSASFDGMGRCECVNEVIGLEGEAAVCLASIIGTIIM